MTSFASNATTVADGNHPMAQPIALVGTNQVPLKVCGGLTSCETDSQPESDVPDAGDYADRADDSQTLAPEVTIDKERRRLLAEWRAGDESARERLIESLTPLVQKLASQKELKYRRSEGEFVDVAWFAMHDALGGLFRCGHSNVGGYITTAVRRAIESEVKKESKRKEVALEAALVEGAEPSVDYFAVFEVWEELFACCDTEADMSILTMKAEGYTVAEIAKELETWRSKIYYRLGVIEKRYCDRMVGVDLLTRSWRGLRDYWSRRPAAGGSTMARIPNPRAVAWAVKPRKNFFSQVWRNGLSESLVFIEGDMCGV